MPTETSRPHQSADGGAQNDPRAALYQAIVSIAERELKQALVRQTRPALGMHLNPSSVETAAVHRAVRAMCSEARRLGLRAEELIIGIKQAWVQLAPVRALHLGERDRDVLREVVSYSIEEFFHAGDASTRERS